MQKYLEDAPVVLENSHIKMYYFVDEGTCIAIREEDPKHSYVLFMSIDETWEDIKESLDGEYFNIVRGTELINTYASKR